MTKFTKVQQNSQIKLVNGILPQLSIQYSSPGTIETHFSIYHSECIVTQVTWSLTAPSIVRQIMIAITIAIITKA